MHVAEEGGLALARQALQAQEYWRLKGLAADVVVWNESTTTYRDEVHGALVALLDSGSWRAWRHRPGGVFLLRGDDRPEAERLLLLSVARATLDEERGSLAQQLEQLGPAESAGATSSGGSKAGGAKAASIPATNSGETRGSRRRFSAKAASTRSRTTSSDSSCTRILMRALNLLSRRPPRL